VLAIGSLPVDPPNLPSAEEPSGLADNHLPMAGIEPSAVRPMLASGVYQSVVERPAAGWKVFVAVYLAPSHLHLEPARSEPMPLCWLGPCTQEASLETGWG
jgi:hypothetical protein